MKVLEQVQYLRVANIERSLAFYRGALGFRVARQLDEGGVPFFARLERDGVAVMISTRASRFLAEKHVHDHSHAHDDEHDFHGVEVAHGGALNLLTYIYVEDVDATYGELRSRAVEPVDAPEDKFYGIREFLLRDPDGYYYAIAQRLDV